MTIYYEQITFQNIEKYKTFDAVANMDEKIYEYIEMLRNDEQPESIIEVLRFLGRSSLRVIGVSFAKYQTIANSIGMSVSTIKRAIKSLKEYGMIEVTPTIKKWLGRGKSRRKSVNLIVIKSECKYDFSQMTGQYDSSNNVEKDEQDKVDTSENQSEPIYNKHTYSITGNTYCMDGMTIRTPYKRFTDTVKQFVGNGKQSVVSRLYGVYRGQTKGLRGNYEDDELINVAIQAIQTTFQAKKTRNIRNLPGFFNGVLSNLLDRMCSDLMAEMFA